MCRYGDQGRTSSDGCDGVAVTAKPALPLRGAWVLVNNAISAADKPIEDVDDADLDRAIRSGIYGSL
jgi:hypothetical protein